MRNLSRPMRCLVGVGCLSLLTVKILGETLPDPAVVADAEKRFARTGWDRGIRESFLQFFAEDSIVFAPGPTDARKFYTDYKDKGRALAWHPVFATISRSGELGVTTGPWELKEKKTDPSAIAHGEFVSVWKQQPDHTWKVIFDCGINHPAPTGQPPDLRLEPPSKDLPAKGELVAALERAEKKYADNLRLSARKALLSNASEDIRILRDDVYPGVGDEMAEKIVTSGEPLLQKISGGGVSDAGDLAYRYGSYSVDGGDGSVSGSFVTIWRVESAEERPKGEHAAENREGGWKIILDLEKKAPPAEKK